MKNSNQLINQFWQIYELLKRANNILIVSHENPDPDAVGSILALRLFLKELNLNSFCYLPTLPSKNLSFLAGFFEIKNEIPPKFLNSEIVLCLDYGDFFRLKLPDSIPEQNLITIDHHRGDQRGQIKIIEPDFSSTAEIIYFFFRTLGIEINQQISTCLLAGISYDTGLFSHTSTSSRTMKVVSQLLLKGAPLIEIIHGVSRAGFPSYFNRDLMKIWGRALSRARLDYQTKLAYSFISFSDLKECGSVSPDFGDICSIISTIFPADISLFLVEYEKGKIKGSLRSEAFKKKRVDLIAQVLGGGGHPFAAGFKQEGTIEEILKKVMDLIK